jgi:hypothetical protein
MTAFSLKLEPFTNLVIPMGGLINNEVGVLHLPLTTYATPNDSQKFSTLLLPCWLSEYNDSV